MKIGKSPRFVVRLAPYCVAGAAAVLAMLAWSGMGSSRTVTASAESLAAADPCETVQVVIGPNVPHDVPQGQRLPPNEESEAQLAAFAWQQFLALCWQSDYNTNTFSRGTPDPNWNYTQPYKPGQPLVWETYAHRSELRPYNVPLTKPFSKAPEYLLGTPTNPANPQTSFTLFNNLDEDSELGNCNVYLGPGDRLTQDVVLYQAKVNQAEYDYIKTNFGKDQYKGKNRRSQIVGGGKLYKAQQANILSIKTNRVPSPNGINLPAGANDGVEGAIEIKTAFLRVTDQNSAMLKDFFQTQAIYYTADYTGGKFSNWTYNNGTFALLGIHVIHKTKSYPDFIFTSFEHKSLATLGFDYIEQAPLAPEYPPSNFNPYNVSVPDGTTSGTQVGNRQPITRQPGPPGPPSSGHLYPVPPCLDAVTKTVHAELAKLNPNSIWLNYRLIGVQANITESWAATPSADAGPNHFMANHVIESDPFLGNFFGPGFGTNPFPTPTPGSPPMPSNGNNVLYNKKTYNMGGCKACHGVAQTAFGTDFSFLLDFGNNKPVVEPDTIISYPDEE